MNHQRLTIAALLAFTAALIGCSERSNSGQEATAASHTAISKDSAPNIESVRSQAKRVQLEVGDIIAKGLDAESQGVLPWDFLARDDSPVVWTTNGIVDNTRDGTVEAAVDSFIPEIIEKKVQHSPWKIHLSGSKFGIARFDLANDGCFGVAAVAPKCIDRLSDIEKTLSLANVRSTKICAFGPGAARSVVYRVQSGSKVGYLHQLNNEGSGGGTISLTLYMRPAVQADELAHDSAMCGVLFAAVYGSDSNVGGAYAQLIK